MLGAGFVGLAAGHVGKCCMRSKRDKLEVPVMGRLAVSKYRTLETWCNRSLRKKAEVVGIVLERVLEIYEEEADLYEPIEHFVRRLHLGEPS